MEQPIFDWDKGDFKTNAQGKVLTCSDAQALEQLILKAQQTTRGAYLIYADAEDPERNHKYGTDVPPILTSGLMADTRDSELKRAIQDALIYDPWITGVYNIAIYEATVDGKTRLYADYSLTTVWDTTVDMKGVVLSD